MFIVFEGIDGSGKTTISNRVAKRLRAEGVHVTHVREGGEFALPVVTRIREFGKDSRNLDLAPLAEVLLYVSRDAQLLTEAIGPALERGDVVFADRYLYSYEVMGADGRGLPREQVRAVLDAVAGGVWPDLVVLCDVDVHIARARRRVGKLAKNAHGKVDTTRSSSRKGLAGVGLQHHMRSGYLKVAGRERDRWLVLDNTYEDLDSVVDRVTAAVLQLYKGRKAKQVIASAEVDTQVEAVVVGTLSSKPEVAAESFYEFVAARAEKEPEVAAQFLSGLDDSRAYAWRDKLLEQAPAVIAAGLRGLDDARAWELRDRLLSAAPYWIARSLHGRELDAARAHVMRLKLIDDQPRGVIASLNGDHSLEAWAIRRRLGRQFPLETLASTRYSDESEAWELREQISREAGAFEDPQRATALAHSLRGLDTARAWELRRALFAAAPTGVLGSLAGVFCDRSWRWRERWAARAAKIVMRTFDGSEDERAWVLRGDHVRRIKEAVDSMIGLDSDVAWEFRERAADLWPSTVLKSLVPLARTARGAAMAERLIERNPTNLSVLKHACRVAAVQAGGAALEVVV